MHARYPKVLLSLAAAAALGVPASALAQGADDGAHHVRQEHRHVAHHARHAGDDRGQHARADDRGQHARGDDRGQDGRGADDGANHR